MKAFMKCVMSFLLCCSILPAAIFFDFEGSTEGWTNGTENQRISLSQKYAYSGTQSLEVTVDGSKTAWMKYPLKTSLHGHETLAFTIYLPEEFLIEATFICYTKDGEWNWFETSPMEIKSGEEKEVKIDISNNSFQLKPAVHLKGWDGFTKQEITEFGIKVFFPQTFTGSFYIDSIEFKESPRTEEVCLFDFRANSGRIKKFEKFEMSFRTSFIPSDPFNGEEFKIISVFKSPSGKSIEVPAFFYNDYIRHTDEDGETLFCYGTGEWKIRFSPEEEGLYSYTINIYRDGKHLGLQSNSFTVGGSNKKGFLRWDRNDPLYISFQNGDFFYPIGHTLRSPDDIRQPYPYEFTPPANRGTFAYDSYFKKMSENKENYARIWMSAWWLGIEWDRSYSPYYKGLGRYNLQNAWRLDYLLDIAEEYGIYIDLTLINHGQFSIRPDAEWKNNPYNIANGGMLESPDEFFVNDAAIDFFKKRLDYIVSRWAYSDNIAFWELWNEIDLTGYYDTLKVRTWHEKTAPYLRSVDPYNHLITTHYCRRDDDPLVWILPHLEILVSNSYNSSIVSSIKEYYLKRKPFEKPMLINEFGAGKSKLTLENNLHGGIWASSMTPMTGIALFWWWPFIDHYDLYHRYKALANYWKGEDRRNKQFQLTDAKIEPPSDKNTGVIGIQNNTEGFFWIYDEKVFSAGILTPASGKNVSLKLANFLPGTYRAEYWDTYKGKLIEKRTFAFTGTTQTLSAPEFCNDIAVKIKKVPQ